MHMQRPLGATDEPVRGLSHPGGRRPWKTRGLVKGPLHTMSRRQNGPSRGQTALLWPLIHSFTVAERLGLSQPQLPPCINKSVVLRLSSLKDSEDSSNFVCQSPSATSPSLVPLFPFFALLLNSLTPHPRFCHLISLRTGFTVWFSTLTDQKCEL